MNRYTSTYKKIFGYYLTEIAERSKKLDKDGRGVSYFTVYKVLVWKLPAKPFTWRKLDKVLKNNPAYLEIKSFTHPTL